MASIVRHLPLVLLVLIASAPHAATAKSGKDSRLPGEGMWRLRFRTLWAEGDGCGEYDMDVRAGDEMETALFIQATDFDLCSAGDYACQYTLNWKCAAFNPESQWPEQEQADAELAWDGSGVSLTVGQAFYSSYGGTFTTLEEDYYVTKSRLSGTETWMWKSMDGTRTCKGEDQVDGKKGYYDCTGVEQDVEESFDARTPPAPEGRWRLKTETAKVNGEGCDQMDMKVGFSTKSSVHITPLANEATGKPDGTAYSVFFRCSTDESLVEWRDDATAVHEGVGGNITLRIERAGFDENMIDPEEGPGGSLVADSYGIGGDASDDAFEETYSVVSLTFCPEYVPGEKMGGENGTKYTVCAGNEAWTWQSTKTGQKCSGIDRYTGVRGDCQEGMITPAEFESALAELEEEEWEREWEEEARQEELQDAQSLQTGVGEKSVAPPPGVTPKTVAKKKKSGKVKINKSKDAFWQDGYEHNRKGYTVFGYRSRRSSFIATLLVGVPIAALAGGAVFAYIRWRRGRSAPPGYSAVRRNVAMSEL